ncbi:MAG: hypothetical protein LR017_01320 [Candidatus Pacebacteria bacterium]|nr:hypothetical protein [Candidatus Paceibacterota bacterium]
MKKRYAILAVLLAAFALVQIFKLYDEQTTYQKQKAFIAEHNQKYADSDSVVKESKFYTDVLPAVPTPREAKRSFVDTNDNGVRDDIEIAIVEVFHRDRQVVESFLLVPKSLNIKCT